MPRRKQAQEGSPTVAARLLANELRQLRMRAGLSQADVARELGCTPGRVGHMETRRNLPRRSDLLVMLQMYKVPPERQVWYLDLAAKAKEKGWWDGAAGVPDWFSVFVGLEWGASAIRNFELGVIPGLLQTSDYMRVLFEKEGNTKPDHLIAQRQRRQGALERAESPLTMHAVIDEGAIRRIVGTTQVMRGQLQYLIAMNDHPQVTVQVVPFQAGSHPGFGGGFHCLDFDSANDLGVIYLETRRGGLYLEEDAEIAEYHAMFERIATLALAPAKSASFIQRLAKEMT